MATINKKATNTVVLKELTTNEEGEIAYVLPSKKRLISRVVGAFWNEDTFYKKGSDIATELIKDVHDVAKLDPKFPLQLAAYARNVLNLRTTPQVLLVECANIVECKPFVREYTPKIVKRADEIADVLAYHIEKFGGENKNHNKIPNSLKKGLAEAFTHFDEYQLNKYSSDKKTISLGDALLLIDRKKDYPVSQALANFLINDQLDEEALPRLAATKQILAQKEVNETVKELLPKSVFTWEMYISHFGSTKENWEAIAPKMGYMAKLRNLRNFIEKGVDLDPILADIENPELVQKSKQLPFRFYSAYKEIEVQRVQRTIANAFEASVSNVQLDGRTAVITDLSGSMTSSLSAKSKLMYKEVGAVMSAIAIKKAKDSVVTGFADTAKEIKLNPDDRMISNIQKIVNTNLGGSTNAHLALDALGTQKVDRIILFSDMQCWDSNAYFGWSLRQTQGDNPLRVAFKKYVKEVNPKVILYSFNLAAYGTSQFPSIDNNVVELSGWSDKVIDYINLLEGQDRMESEIAKW